MSVGGQAGYATIDTSITNYTVTMRNLMQAISNLSIEINSTDNGLAVLEGLGYSSAANPANPGGISDAQYALSLISYLNTMAAIYFGTAAQAAAFDFNNELAPMWAGQ